MKLALLVWCSVSLLGAVELHVSAAKGNDSNDGSAGRPFRTISAAARVAQPGDAITVHQGTYRERVTPPRGGESDSRRITYQAAPGEVVEIKGSEAVRGWVRYRGDVWKLMLPNSYFGNYNPYKDLIAGDWFTDKGRPHHTGEVYLNGQALLETNLLENVLKPEPFPDARDPEASRWKWYTESDDAQTHIYANFHGADPNRELVEINVRDACFYPDQPGRNFITIRGFRMRHAATQWAAPTAEQIGLVGTHWSKGWVIENNEISDSKCSCITLGKDRATGHNVWTGNPLKDGATHYNEVILRARDAGWSRENIGGHVVRNNTIHDCEQAGIAGSLGAVFSQITGNHIYNVWAKRQFTGAEMGGIKLHGAIDVLIKGNRIHNAGRGLWMDWMAQGTRISSNLLYDNTTDDLFVEVNHGPFLVDNNVFVSPVSLLDMSEGGAYVHNLMAGKIVSRPELNRWTPYHRPHSTALAGVTLTLGGDDRFYNNMFVGRKLGEDAYGLASYDMRKSRSYAAGNVYLNGARPSTSETNPIVLMNFDPAVRITDQGREVEITFSVPDQVLSAPTVSVTTELLGKTRVAEVGYEEMDGSTLNLGNDYFGEVRADLTRSVGPFGKLSSGEVRLRVWK
ncbi:MAG: right-handed parallel beta-helix repeat-containing protein [Bryobacterales bacterium]|nr:right-handed parallel beta-helix repeat-containing protein [Bryobacterales bacterium]